MPSSLLATLRAASGGVFVCDGTDPGFVQCINGTVAGLKDADDLTLAEVYVGTDFISVYTGWHWEDWTLDGAGPVSWSIEKLVVRLRAKRVSGAGLIKIRPRINGVLRGTPVTLSYPPAFNWHEFTFTTDPGDGQPWTLADLTQQFGFEIRGENEQAVNDSKGQVSEFEVQVWGTITVTPQRAAATTTARKPGGTEQNRTSLPAGTEAVPEAVEYLAGARSLGDPQYAARLKIEPGPRQASSVLTSAFVALALRSPPVRRLEDDEVHWIAEYAEDPGDPLIGLGVTPDLRIAMRHGRTFSVLKTQAGLARADGQMFWLLMRMDSGSPMTAELLLGLGETAAQLAQGRKVLSARGSPGDGYERTARPHTRAAMQLFSGLDMTSRIDLTIYRARIELSDQSSIDWPGEGASFGKGLALGQFERGDLSRPWPDTAGEPLPLEPSSENIPVLKVIAGNPTPTLIQKLGPQSGTVSAKAISIPQQPISAEKIGHIRIKFVGVHKPPVV